MSKIHWLLLVLMFQVFTLLGQVQDLWSACALVILQWGLAYWYVRRPRDNSHVSEAFDLGFKLAEKHNDIQNDLDFLYDRLASWVEKDKVLPFKAKKDLKKGQGVCIGLRYNIPKPAKEVNRIKKSSKKRK